MVVASRIVLLWLIIGLPLGILATVGLVYLIRHLANRARFWPRAAGRSLSSRRRRKWTK